MKFITHLSNSSVLIIFVSVLIILIALFGKKDAEKCISGQCTAVVSRDAGKFGSISFVSLSKDELRNIKSITVEKTSFFRIKNPEGLYSEWYYSPSFAEGHSTKIFYNFNVVTKHSLVRAIGHNKNIIIEINTVGNFGSCPEIILNDQYGISNRICVDLPTEKSAFKFFLAVVFLPTFISILFLIKSYRRRTDILLIEAFPSWFSNNALKASVNEFKFKYDLRLIGYFLLGFISTLFRYRHVSQNLYNTKSFRTFIKNCALFYSIGYIAFHKPRVVLSFVDNSQFLIRLAGMLKQVQFVSVQNGFRSRLEIRRIFTDVKHNFSIPNYDYLCLSEAQKNEFKNELSLDEAKILIPFGSSVWKQIGLGRANFTSPNEEKEHVVSFISQWHPFHYQDKSKLDKERHAAQRNLKVLIKALKLLCSRGIIVQIILRTTQPKERVFYQNKLGKNLNFVEASLNRKNSYQAAFGAELLVAMSSTLAIEADLYGVNTVMVNPVASAYFNTKELVKLYVENISAEEIVDVIISNLSLSKDFSFKYEAPNETSLQDHLMSYLGNNSDSGI